MLITMSTGAVLAEENVESLEAVTDLNIPAKSAVLMDYNTGTVLYEQNADEPLPPASVTKIMTLLLIMEALDKGSISYDSDVSVSEYAASMGGSQVFLEAGESLKADEMLKSIVIASANDAAVAMAEAVAGSESAFVEMMNKKAQELDMENTHFENVTGLDDDTVKHVTSARDIAIMSRELMKYKKIFEYSTVWMDSIRNGEFGLTNTNRLIRFYNGATGLKTGSTHKAGFCISATAERDGLHLIAVIMGAETRDVRNEAAKSLLDHGFANYSIYTDSGDVIPSIQVKRGVKTSTNAEYKGCRILVPKGEAQNVTVKTEVESLLTAPLRAGARIGSAQYILNDKIIFESDVILTEDIPQISFFGLVLKLFSAFILR